jgi:hypothetical protein
VYWIWSTYVQQVSNSDPLDPTEKYHMASFSHLNMLVVLGNKKALLVGSTVWRIVDWHDMISRSGPVPSVLHSREVGGESCLAPCSTQHSGSSVSSASLGCRHQPSSADTSAHTHRVSAVQTTVAVKGMITVLSLSFISSLPENNIAQKQQLMFHSYIHLQCAASFPLATVVTILFI